MRLLDLFCCEGGAAVGYHRAGFDIIGVDTSRARLRHYPFMHAVDDALRFLRDAASDYRFDAIHASPPCQAYTRGNAGRDTDWPRLIEPVRELLVATGKPYVIENVADARPELHDPVTLCGCMFDLSTIDTDGERIHLQRARLFETNFPLTAPRECDHSDHEWVAGAYGGARRDKHEAKYVRKGGYVPKDKDVVQRLLGIEHPMTWNGLFESIPPAYTEFIGHALAAHIRTEAAA